MSMIPACICWIASLALPSWPDGKIWMASDPLVNRSASLANISAGMQVGLFIALGQDSRSLVAAVAGLAASNPTATVAAASFHVKFFIDILPVLRSNQTHQLAERIQSTGHNTKAGT